MTTCCGPYLANGLTMARTTWLLAVLLAAAPASAQGRLFDPHSGPRPLIVWIQTDPWAMVLDADTPLLSLYEDGTMICRVRGRDSSSDHRRKQLSKRPVGPGARRGHAVAL